MAGTSREPRIELRAAGSGDIALLRHWDEQLHVIASDPNDDREWATGLHLQYDWREQLMETTMVYRAKAKEMRNFI